jgi:PP-loop superfamily ATP-utilizing enzyme
MNYCSRCGIPKVENLPFNEAGECQICENWEDYRLKKKGDFSAIAETIRERGFGKPFDCIVGISGGRDSTYMLYQLVNKYSLRCAAIFVENVFSPIEILDNVDRIAEELKVDLFRYKIPPDYHLQVARRMISFWQKSRDPLFSNLACAPCKYFNKYIFELANRMKVNSVLYGGNPYEFFYVGPGDTSRSRGGKLQRLPEALH